MRKQKGFGLLEILITLVLLGVGVAGLVALARNMISAAQEGRRYEVAMRLAESKIDELRSFNSVTNAVSGAVPPFYTSIVSGAISNLKPSDAGGSYDLLWDVYDQYFISGAWSTVNSAAAPYPDRKAIRVTAKWQDNTDKAHNLILDGAISPTGSFTKNNLSHLLTPREKVEVDYTKGSVPDVVAVELGNGSIKETSKPLPNIASDGISRLIQFDTATYTAGTTNKRQAMQDTSTVYCSCTTVSGNPVQAYLPAQPNYIESSKVQYWKVGTQLDKAIGALKNPNQSNQQAALCHTCCREHYDLKNSQNFSSYYAPLLNNSRDWIVSGQGDYVDACRFIRIDGVYQPAPDWNLISLTTFSDDFLKVPANLAAYQRYIAYAVMEHARLQKSAFANYSDSGWASSRISLPAVQTFKNWGEDQNPEISTDLTTLVGTVQLISRGIYVDIMSPSYLRDEVFKQGDSPDLAKIPFQDVNLTLLSKWSSSDIANPVTSQPIPTNNNKLGTFSRGRLTANSPTSTPITISTESYQGNSGVVGDPISQSDIDGTITATLQVSIQGSAQLPITNVNGVIKCLDLLTTTTTTGTGQDRVTVTTNSAVPCTKPSDKLQATVTVSTGNVTCTIQDIGSPAEASYSCSGAAGSIFTLALAKNKYQFSPATPLQFTLPSSGTLPGGCVLMVSDDLKDATPAPNPAIPSSCNIQP